MVEVGQGFNLVLLALALAAQAVYKKRVKALCQERAVASSLQETDVAVRYGAQVENGGEGRQG